MKIASIDVGFSGAIAVFDTNKKSVEVRRMPVIRSNKKDELDETEIRKIIRGVEHVYIEKATAMPKQGVVSTGRFLMGYGMLRGICAGLGVPYSIVLPQRWKKAVMDGMGKDKRASVLRAKQLFPDIELGKNDHGKADALLIGFYVMGDKSGNKI